MTPPKQLNTDSPYPLVVAIDVTGSMEEWPEIFFDKLPLLYEEVARYLPGVEISFAAVGDAYSDSYPLQVGGFKSGKKLDDVINSLYPEGGGGGQAKETYELCGYYYAKNTEMPKAKKPIFIFLGDEGFYPYVNKDHVSEYTSGTLTEKLSGQSVMKDLASKFDTYILRKDYGGSDEENIKKQWKRALGPEKVMGLDDPSRVVDCIIGIVASAAGEFEDYTTRLIDRQTQAQVSQVMTSIRPVANKLLGKAVSLKKLPPGKKSTKLGA